MTIQPSGPISLSDLQTEFGGSNPISLNEYYRGGGTIPLNYPTNIANGSIPLSGQNSLGNYYNTLSDFYMAGDDLNVYFNGTDHIRYSGLATAYVTTIDKIGQIRVTVRHAFHGVELPGSRTSHVRLFVNGVAVAFGTSGWVSGVIKTEVWDVNVNANDVIVLQHTNGLDVNQFIYSITYDMSIDVLDPVI